MSRVLIWKNVKPGSEYDIFRGISCAQQYHVDVPFNVGNRLWFQGLMSAIDTGENEYHFLEDELNVDKINADFDFIILPMANIFNEKFLHYINSLSEEFAKIHIPVYVLACGAQAEAYGAIDELIFKIGEPSKRFISSIYKTGGEFGLRGEFTKEFFTKLGFPSAVVTGCPSMYQLGRNFCIPLQKAECIAPVFNGRIELLSKLILHHQDSLYIDQDCFWHSLYRAQSSTPSLKSSLACFCNFGQAATKLLGEDRVRLIPDMNNWREFLKNSHYNYSFGSRIHGNIMAILSGIPATVVAVDTRTREMADFFDIPYIVYSPGHVYTPEELTTLYASADYTKFNENYSRKFDLFSRFLVDYKIVSSPNEINAFFNQQYSVLPHAVNTEYYRHISDIISATQPLQKLGRAAINMRNTMRRK